MAKRQQTYKRDARKKKALRIRTAIALRAGRAEMAAEEMTPVESTPAESKPVKAKAAAQEPQD